MYFISKATMGYFHFEIVAQHYLNCCRWGGDMVPGTSTKKRNVNSEKALESVSKIVLPFFVKARLRVTQR